jgi:hypothetical protein
MDLKDKFKLMDGVLDTLTAFINPELYLKSKEKEIKKNVNKMDPIQEPTNTEFGYIQAYGRATGRFPVDSEVYKAALKAGIIVEKGSEKPVVAPTENKPITMDLRQAISNLD